MARPRQGDDLKITYRKQGDRMYAYQVTSRMENGKKTTKTTYLGRVDPETHELLGKIPGKSFADREKISDQRKIEILNDVHVGEYGQVYLLDRIQKSISLGDDLYASFSETAIPMLAVSMMLLQTDDVFDAVDAKMNSTWIKRFYGIEGVWDSGTLSRFTKKVGSIGKGNIERFFEKRISRNEGIVAWDTTTIGCHSDMDGMSEYVVNNKDGEDLKQIKLGFATDIRGVPMMYRFYPGNVSDMDTVKNLAMDIESFGGADAVFVMDRGFCSGSNIRMLLNGGFKFVMPASVTSKAVRKLLTRFPRTKETVDMEHNGHMYRVWKTELGIVEDTGRLRANGEQAYSFSIKENESDDDFGPEGKLTAYVCYDSKKYSDEVQNHKRMINDLKKFASEIDSPNPDKVFKKKAGKAAKHFEMTVNGRKITVKEKKNSRSYLENRAGTFIMLTSEGIEWDTMMQMYDARGLTEQAYDKQKGTRKRFGTSDKDRMEGMEFLRFLDLILKCEISALLRECKDKHSLSVESVIAMSSCIQAKEFQGVYALNEIDKKQRRVFEVLGIDLPVEPLMGQSILRPQA